MTAPPPSAVGAVLAHALARDPTLGRTRLVCIDGPAGSGKTTLAGALAAFVAHRASVAEVHMDDLYDGWAGLATAPERVARDIVDPLRDGRPGRYRRYDWLAGRFAETRDVPPVDVLVLEGVGAGARRYADAITTLVWVEAPADLRLRRGLARDGEDQRAHWERWMCDEQAHLAAEDTRDRADLWVDGRDLS